MIVRILGEGQFEVPDDRSSALEGFDEALATAVDAGDEDAFRAALDAATALVREVGTSFESDRFAPSDLVLPFADATIEETEQLLLDEAPAGADE